ncbi:MAG TPA: hypothetical protein VIK37_03140 [Candidatus Saccharimonadales bacterium]
MILPLFAFIKSVPVVFAACSGNNLFFFLPPWYKYLLPDKMNPTSCSLTDAFQFPNDIWLIGIAVLEMLLRLAGLAAVVAIIFSGVRYMFAGGNVEKAVSARRALVNSFIGLGVALVAAGFVAFIGNRLGG